MKDINSIRQQVEDYLNGIYVDGGVSTLDEATIENQEFFVFFYQSKEYLQSLNESYLLAGNAPIIVDKKAGEMYLTGTAHRLEYYFEEFKKGRLRKI